MMLKDRFQAGKLLARRLLRYKGACIVLAIPRGGIQVGYEIARELEVALEPVLVKKIGHPLNPELAVGAVSLQGEFLDPAFEIPGEYLREEIQKLRRILRERQAAYLKGSNPSNLKGKTVILTDNGIATGSTILAAITMIRKEEPARIVVAAAVAPSSVIGLLREKADEVVCLSTPEGFMAVGQFYQEFDQVSDEEAIRLLDDHRHFMLQKAGVARSAERFR